jgi:NAD(P)-dependent dehydrogenase (short-subunit alcohol dehydrogenase family)
VTLLDRFRLGGRVALVSGASSGLGVAFAQALAEAGADVALAARRADRLADTAALVRQAGRRAIVVTTDVTDPAACEAVVDATVRELGRLDILVNNAGVGAATPALRESPEEFRRVLDINLNACYSMAEAAAGAMRPGSSIINVSSIAAMLSVGLPQAAYTASKAALIGLTEDLARQWTGRRGIRVNAIAPGFFHTEMTGGWFTRYFPGQLGLIPAGRAGTPEELAASVVFLAGDGASYVTGQLLVIDGGRSLL